VLRRIKIPGLVLLVLCFSFSLAPRPVFAESEIEWTLKKQLTLDVVPKDVVPSADGKWIYVLTPGEILVYSLPDYKVATRIPVDKTFDRMTFSDQNNSLIVSSTAEKTVKIIQLDFVHQFSLEGLPFQGPANAPVTLVVFSDYQ